MLPTFPGAKRNTTLKDMHSPTHIVKIFQQNIVIQAALGYVTIVMNIRKRGLAMH